ncbi:MAG: MFS transporter [Bacteroidales bacterium]|nr:MFS transporter [Bacteroidales bacterium]
MKSQSPWYWVPTLYFAEGLPYFIVNNISLVMFKNMGMPNGQLAFFTSLLYLPWVIKPLWSPFVDIIRTKRWWIRTMQIIMSAAMLALPFILPYGNGVSMETGGLFFACLGIFWVTAFASATHDIAADGFYMLALNPHDQKEFVGIRSTFYRLASWFGQGALVAIAGIIDQSTWNISLAWKMTLLLPALIFAAITLAHVFTIPHAAEDAERPDSSISRVARDFLEAFKTFFMKKQIVIALLFMLFFRLPEALLLKMAQPFLLDSRADGGLGLTNTEVGLAYGTIGIIALTIGGILGGLASAKWGLRKSMWPMALSLALPSGVFLLMSVLGISDIWLVSACIAFDQFGYGFGFTAYMLYLIYFSNGSFKTAHYSICTAFMALSMMLPGLVAGYLQESLGYTGFFSLVMVCCLVTVLVTFLVKVEE